MVRIARWSWNDLARSLNQAGITYANGGRWTGDLLRVKAANVRLERRRREHASATQQILPIEFLRATLGNVGSINQLVVNVQATPSGTYTVAPGTDDRSVTPAVATNLSASALQSPALDPPPSSALPAAAETSIEPSRRTFGVARPRGWDPMAKQVPQPSPRAETPVSSAEPVIDVEEVLARFTGKARTPQ